MGVQQFTLVNVLRLTNALNLVLRHDRRYSLIVYSALRHAQTKVAVSLIAVEDEALDPVEVDFLGFCG